MFETSASETAAGDRLRANLEAVRATIAERCGRVGRDPAGVQIVAVTKSVDLAVIRVLLELGVAELGENRVQQLVQRAGEIAEIQASAAPRWHMPRWHMIGHLQRNKARAVLGHSRFIHSVDSGRLAQEIQRHAAALGSQVEVLIEVNVSGEESKEGLPRGEVAQLAREIGSMPNLRLRGLMTMAPLSEEAERARPCFAGLRELLKELRAGGTCSPECDQLSMGMSGDFPVAVEEGATIVRLGSILFEGLR